jgi:hypothetical protein
MLPEGAGIDETATTSANHGLHELRPKENIAVNYGRNVFSLMIRQDGSRQMENDIRRRTAHKANHSLDRAIVKMHYKPIPRVFKPAKRRDWAHYDVDAPALMEQKIYQSASDIAGRASNECAMGHHGDAFLR